MSAVCHAPGRTRERLFSAIKKLSRHKVAPTPNQAEAVRLAHGQRQSFGASEPNEHEEDSCPNLKSGYLNTMSSALSAKPPRRSSHRVKSTGKLAGSEIHDRLAQIELATVSSLRALQMDIEGDEGIPSSEVLKKARQALR